MSGAPSCDGRLPPVTTTTTKSLQRKAAVSLYLHSRPTWSLCRQTNTTDARSQAAEGCCQGADGRQPCIEGSAYQILTSVRGSTSRTRPEHEKARLRRTLCQLGGRLSRHWSRRHADAPWLQHHWSVKCICTLAATRYPHEAVQSRRSSQRGYEKGAMTARDGGP